MNYVRVWPFENLATLNATLVRSTFTDHLESCKIAKEDYDTRFSIHLSSLFVLRCIETSLQFHYNPSWLQERQKIIRLDKGESEKQVKQSWARTLPGSYGGQLLREGWKEPAKHLNIANHLGFNHYLGP